VGRSAEPSGSMMVPARASARRVASGHRRSRLTRPSDRLNLRRWSARRLTGLRRWMLCSSGHHYAHLSAVLAHEIPHELGDFAILLNAGYSRRRALMLNSLSEIAGLVGDLTAVNTLRRLPRLSPHFLAFSSASFVYVAMADLMPEMHRGAIDVAPRWQVVTKRGHP